MVPGGGHPLPYRLCLFNRKLETPAGGSQHADLAFCSVSGRSSAGFYWGKYPCPVHGRNRSISAESARFDCPGGGNLPRQNRYDAERLPELRWPLRAEGRHAADCTARSVRRAFSGADHRADDFRFALLPRRTRARSDRAAERRIPTFQFSVVAVGIFGAGVSGCSVAGFRAGAV